MSAQRTRFGLLAGLGLAGLGLLLLRLGVTFSWELRAVDEQIASEQATLELYVRRTLELTLARLVTDRSAAVAEAERDPLREEPGVVLLVDGEQILPRLAEASPSLPDRLAERLAVLRSPRPAIDDEALAERATLLAQASAAMDRGDATAIDRAVRAFLVHRARTRLALVDELASSLVLLERFVATGAADPAFLRAVLEKGMSDPKLGRVPGLESELLEHRGELSRADFALAQAALLRLGGAAGLDQERFLALAQARPQRLAWPKVEGPSVVQGARGERYAALRLGSRVIGVPLDLSATTHRIEEEMMERGLLHLGDQLRIELPIAAGSVGGGPSPPADVAASPAELRIVVSRPLWAASQHYAQRVFAEKTGLLVLCFGLAAGLIGFASHAQRRRQELLDHRTEFVATVSHELRTPLAAVRVLAETLERRLAGDPKAKDYPTRIVKEADRLGALVENILSFQRVERGRWEPKMTRVRVEDLVSALREEAARAGNGRAVLETAGLTDVEVWADPELLSLALANLVRNGIRYSTRDPAVIRLSARLEGDVVLAVEDNGIGIAEDEKAQIFEPYVRGRRGSGRGTGLGLALVSKIMDIHRGAVSLAATSEEGSRFELRFPRAQGAS